MTEVTVVQERRGRGAAFWIGLLIGIIAEFSLVALLWFLGVIDILPSETTSTNTTNNATVQETVSNEVEPTNTAISNLTAIESSFNEVTSPSAQNDNVSAVMARDVDDQANPVDETNEFTTDDDRFYVVVTFADKAFSDGKREGAEVMVDWFKDGDKFGSFSTTLSANQQKVYFYQNNNGVGEYEAVITLDGQEVVREKFSVNKS